MIKKIIQQIVGSQEGPNAPRMVIIDPGEGDLADLPKDPDLRTIGLFSDIQEEKVADIIHAMIYLNETNKIQKDPKKK